jgi:poly-gamma-glutamate capsule biosynthesis protein CapA/YwtB (metallophosphatase superfamily)
MARPLVDAGFDAVSLGNNHAADLGIEGLRQTPILLQERGIEPLGAARDPGSKLEVRSLDVLGTRIAVLSVTTRSNFALPPAAPNVATVPEHELSNALGPLLQEASPTHDLVVVLLHWGVEYARFPETVQRLAARALVDAGADLVIGHHPHVLQEVELYRDAVIAYSLGNFLFGNLAPDPRLTGVLSIDVEQGDVEQGDVEQGDVEQGDVEQGARCHLRVRFDPAVMRGVPFIHPKPATGDSARKARQRVLPLDREQRARWQRDGEALVTELRRETCSRKN